jgi:hypothetical protein
VTRKSAIQVIARAALSRADESRILALPYPIDDQAFWQVLADVGMTQERLMELMGASP